MAVRESPQLAELCYQVYSRPHAAALSSRNLTVGLDTAQKWEYNSGTRLSFMGKSHNTQTPRSYRSVDPLC